MAEEVEKIMDMNEAMTVNSNYQALLQQVTLEVEVIALEVRHEALEG